VAPSTPPARTRDYRLDFFRGVALIMIFIDHIPANPLSQFTLRSYALSDAAEVFIFISGFTAALVYGRTAQREGALIATARIWRRVWQLYVAHICIFMIYMAVVAWSLHHFNPLFADDLGASDFMTQPDTSIIRALLLLYQPALLDILPLYIALLLTFPLVILALRRHVLVALIPSALLYIATQIWGFDMPGNEDEGWYFNPFAWQFLFVIAAASGYSATLGRPTMPRGRWLLWLAGAIALAGFVIQASWTLHDSFDWVRPILHRSLWPVEKGRLPPLRLLNMLSLAVVAAHLVPRDAAFLRRPAAWFVILCGQNSLEVFCLSILLSVLGGVLMAMGGRTLPVELGVNAAGIMLMVGLGLVMAWYGSGGRWPVPPPLDRPA
jgi:hypothetical protein